MGISRLTRQTQSMHSSTRPPTGGSQSEAKRSPELLILRVHCRKPAAGGRNICSASHAARHQSHGEGLRPVLDAVRPSYRVAGTLPDGDPHVQQLRRARVEMKIAQFSASPPLITMVKIDGLRNTDVAPRSGGCTAVLPVHLCPEPDDYPFHIRALPR